MSVFEASTRRFPVVDISIFENGDTQLSQQVAKELAEACHSYGFCAIKGHGLFLVRVQEAFECTRKFFSLPLDVKMQAPHPPVPRPHRGYSSVGKEKVYSREELEKTQSSGNTEVLRRITDLKESYEIGSEANDFERNIWIPDAAFEQFKPFMLEFYEELNDVASKILKTLAAGLDITAHEKARFLSMNSEIQNQLRLLHYPSITRQQLAESEAITRLPAHKDFTSFTILFQDTNGGLEFRDPATQQWCEYKGTEDTILMNIGGSLARFTNGHLSAAEHRVTIPSLKDLAESQSELPARYSIPYFVCPMNNAVIEPLKSFVNSERPAQYDSVRYDEWVSQITKYQYVGKA